MSPVDVLHYASYVCLFVSTWELGSGLNDELDYVWRRPMHWDFTRSLYFVSRYFSLASHIITITWTYFLRSRAPPYPSNICRQLLGYMSMGTQLMLGTIDLILMLRVYALWNRDRKIATLLIAIVVLKATSAIGGLFIFLPEQEFTDSCLLANVKPGGLLGFLLPEFFIPIIIVYLTNTKKRLLERPLMENGWPRITFLSHLNHDSWTTLGVISVAITVCAAFAMRVHDVGDATQGAFPILITILSSLGCRLIMKTRNFGRSDSLELTELSLATTDTMKTRSTHCESAIQSAPVDVERADVDVQQKVTAKAASNLSI